MAYNEKALASYLELVGAGVRFRSPTCPYCRDGIPIKHVDPVRKPKCPWEFWKRIQSSGDDVSPMYVVGPMVDQSELPFRILCRRYGATLAYSPMLHAKSFAQSASYRKRYFSTTLPLWNPSLNETSDSSGQGKTNRQDCDHPLFVQFCGNDPETVLTAARYVEDYCEAVDFNLGCPQGIARRGHYGSFLMEDWELIHNILHMLVVELRVPVTAKMRVFDDELLTLKYAEMLRDTGIYVLCVHGRTRENKGQQTKPADLDIIRRVHEHLGGTIPIITNGNVLTFEDVPRNLAKTNCEGIMCAEPLLWDPCLFAPAAGGALGGERDGSKRRLTVRTGRLFAERRPSRLAAISATREYLELVRRFPVDIGFVKAHMFKMLYHSYEMHPHFQQWLSEFSVASNFNNAMMGRGSDEGGEEEKESGDGSQGEGVMQTPGIFTAMMDALDDHLRKLLDAEVSLPNDDEQPKRGKKTNDSEGVCGSAARKEDSSRTLHFSTYTDFLNDDGTFGIDF
ncbi:putative Dihydrouridine synthase (Dus) [Trypanosoma vivax]|uniref:tRNA-dihydrouridine(16/17) synthase [NAD(P)(+)] n=1 Tax=Trypanosoma vivax (strain Y486) TaxID=1055687 RepID=G0TUX0_TRYVY|nr:putative dihydrouridine synthase [Trypanosoma vivax]KAH8617715.1 putative Dihydrouridine synthase (Dus) [Trypanosoma vivax]CCC47757.1 putative dihydrouridine synthase [Trypanosoma vivax Y486]